jgi:hypothetical protein
MTKLEQARKLLADRSMALPCTKETFSGHWIEDAALSAAAVNQYATLLEVVEAAKKIDHHAYWCATENDCPKLCDCGADRVHALIQKWEEES